MMVHTVDPSTGERLRSYPVASQAEVGALLGRSEKAFASWRLTPFTLRARVLRAASRILHVRRAALARLAASEMGKPVTDGLAEVAKCRTVLDYYARHGASFLRSEVPPGAPAGALVRYVPLGPLLAVMPWNYPFWQVFRAAAPALMAGNTVVLKHASGVTGCALAIERVFSEAGLPRGAFQALVLPGSRTEGLVGDPRIRAVTLTGSTQAGMAVAAAAGAALKPGVYELGGSDPYLVLEDADLELAAASCAASRLLNAGQSCISAKRFIVERTVLGRFETLFARALSSYRVGPPGDPRTQVGPLARADLRDELHGQVTRSVRRGARLILGGKRPSGPGAYYPPTLLSDVRPGMPAYGEELFGPVAAIIPVDGEDEAVRVANDTVYGLGAGVFSRSRARALRVASRISAGTVALNGFVRSHPAMPFGGTRQSGHGRELGPHGIREFVNVQTVLG